MLLRIVLGSGKYAQGRLDAIHVALRHAGSPAWLHGGELYRRLREPSQAQSFQNSELGVGQALEPGPSLQNSWLPWRSNAA